MSQTFTYVFKDSLGDTDTITVTAAKTATAFEGGYAYGVTAITGTFEGQKITGMVGKSETVQNSTGNTTIFDNAIFTSNSYGGTYNGYSGSVYGLDVYGIEFSAGGQEYNLYSESGAIVDVAATGSGTGTVQPVTITTSNAPCFCEGTRILTARGEVPVEALAVGDRVVTFTGRGTPLKPVLWIGRTAFDARRHPNPSAVWPVRIKTGALGAAMPQRDLLVSPDHCLLLGDALIPAKLLVNGATIVQDRRVTRGMYYHVEVEGHDILLSEGVPSETYLDTGNRGMFEDETGLRLLHPDFTPKTNDQSCRPLLMSGPALAAVRATLLSRAGEMGYVAVDEPDLHLVTDTGLVIRPVCASEQLYHFTLPEPARGLTLVSRRWVPMEHNASSHDTRQLGVSVSRIALDDEPLPLHDAALTAGWHAAERSEHWHWRWTTGAATLPAAARRVTVELFRSARYWLHDDALSGAAGAAE